VSGMWIAILVSLALLASTALLHYEVLLNVSRLTPHLSIPIRSRILVVIAAVFTAHIVEVCIYAVAFYLLRDHFGLGTLEGDLEGGALDFFYFSVTTYTTLGVGDLSPTGAIRLVAGVEALNGFVLIGWSASFTYLAMQDAWEEHGGAKRREAPQEG
jgi:Ion channel